MAVALIVAAGRGERLGVGRPKALVPVGGRPMLQWSVNALASVPRVKQIVVALPADHLADAPTGVTAVPGGGTRSESVLAALSALARPGSADNRDRSADEDVVIVHDAARLFAAPELFEAAIDELLRSGADAVVAAAPVTDTIKQTGPAALAGGAEMTVITTLDRSTLWAVQTPQVFRREALEQALAADPELLARATDDAWLVEQQGGTVKVLPASPRNFKITTALDLRLAELIIADDA